MASDSGEPSRPPSLVSSAMVVPQLDAALIDQAAAALAAGRLVAFPTETVYGLGARADDEAAVARIFKAKGRPSDHPLIVHVLDTAGADAFAQEVPSVARRLMQAFWPGPLTLIVPRREGAARACAGGQDSIGLRCPSHPLARELLSAAAQLGVTGVAAPSANRFGRVSPTTAEHVRGEFGTELMVLDGGPCEVGIESAIVDCTRGIPVLLRPGVLTRQAIEQAAGQALAEPDSQAPRASGTLDSHYAPRSRLRLIARSEMRKKLMAAHGPAVALYSVDDVQSPKGLQLIWRPMPQDSRQAAHDLFAALRELDDAVAAAGGSEIWVEEPPREPEWEGVRDRLRRAAA